MDQQPSSTIPIIGNNLQMREVLQNVEKIGAGSASTVLIRGESGTGKELIARKLHACGPSAAGPFIELNCATIPETLLEAELFGYEKGAFTDARTAKKGLLELAHEGTIFLDEIDALSMNLQAKLLKVLDSKVFRHLGGVEEIQVDVRIIAATNANLEEAIAGQAFREDLYYRLNVISIDVPPLRERGDDVLMLAQHFIDRYNEEYGKQVRGLAAGAAKLVLSYSWPGNVRELKNVLERAVLLVDKDIVEAEDLAIDRRTSSMRLAPWAPIVRQGIDDESQIVRERRNGASHPTLVTSIDADKENGITIRIPEEGVPYDDVEKCFLEESLRMTRWNIRRAARLLYMSYDTFRYRMQKHGIR